MCRQPGGHRAYKTHGEALSLTQSGVGSQSLAPTDPLGAGKQVGLPQVIPRAPHVCHPFKERGSLETEPFPFPGLAGMVAGVLPVYKSRGR